MKEITIVYELRLTNSEGEIIEVVNNDKPFKCSLGTNTLLPKFEENISGLNTGDNFSFILKCEDAYGPASEDAVANIPKNVFEVDGVFDSELIKIGSTVPMVNSDGEELYGIVMDVNKTHVIMDFNHPLADEDLFFSGKVISIN